MPRFLVLLLCAFAVLSLGAGATAHAAETMVCIEEAAGGSGAHSSDEQQPEKPDSGKSYQHQHGCHGHHFAALATYKPESAHALIRSRLFAPVIVALQATASHPALRPPQA